MRVAIHQPNYAPWCGYFTKLLFSDVFILLDDTQLPLGRSYVSRVRVRGPAGPQWLSIPVERHHGQRICDVRIASDQATWPRKHLATLASGYARAPFRDEILALLAPLYAAPGDRLADWNTRLLLTMLGYLGIERRLVRASELGVPGSGDERLVSLVRAVGGDAYLSGPGGQNYQDPQRFAAANVKLEVRAYEPVPYPQGDGPFLPGLSVLDALFCCGRAARDLFRYSAG
jgi:hypothetical protein